MKISRRNMLKLTATAIPGLLLLPTRRAEPLLLEGLVFPADVTLYDNTTMRSCEVRGRVILDGDRISVLDTKLEGVVHTPGTTRSTIRNCGESTAGVVVGMLERSDRARRRTV